MTQAVSGLHTLVRTRASSDPDPDSNPNPNLNPTPQTALNVGQYTPTCPLCRTEIERMSDLIKEKDLAETIFALFPKEVMAKVTTTHSLERQKALAATIKVRRG